MAIGDGGGNTVDLQEVLDEFGTNSQPTTDSLLACLQRIFASSTGNLNQFDGTGKPLITNFALSSKTSTSITPTITITTNKIDATVYYVYFSGDSLIPDEADFADLGESTSTQVVTGASSPTTFNSLVIDSLSPSTTYYIMVTYYNNFINQATSDYRTTYDDVTDTNITTAYLEVTTDAPPTLATPTSVVINSYDSVNLIFDVSWDFTDSNASPPYTFQWRIKEFNGSWSDPQDFETTGRINWDNTTTSKGGDAMVDFVPNEGEFYQIQVRALKTNFITSNWSVASNYFEIF